MAAETKHKIRVAVFIPVFGLPSEIWSVRQCLGFKNIEPIVICWHVDPGTPSDKYGFRVPRIICSLEAAPLLYYDELA